jgi:hypothetical protein
MGENKYHVKFSLNLTNNFKYKETSPEFTTGEHQKKKKRRYQLLTQNIIGGHPMSFSGKMNEFLWMIIPKHVTI